VLVALTAEQNPNYSLSRTHTHAYSHSRSNTLAHSHTVTANLGPDAYYGEILQLPVPTVTEARDRCGSWPCGSWPLALIFSDESSKRARSFHHVFEAREAHPPTNPQRSAAASPSAPLPVVRQLSSAPAVPKRTASEPREFLQSRGILISKEKRRCNERRAERARQRNVAFADNSDNIEVNASTVSASSRAP
jgi:hypothetical protein